MNKIKSKFSNFQLTTGYGYTELFNEVNSVFIERFIKIFIILNNSFENLIFKFFYVFIVKLLAIFTVVYYQVIFKYFSSLKRNEKITEFLMFRH